MEFNLKFLFFILFFVCPVWLSAEEFVFRNTLSDADWTVLERAEGPVSVCAALTDVDDEDMKRFAPYAGRAGRFLLRHHRNRA